MYAQTYHKPLHQYNCKHNHSTLNTIKSYAHTHKLKTSHLYNI